MLHTGLRSERICRLTRSQASSASRSGTLQVLGKRNKYRESLNATARAALKELRSKASKAITRSNAALSPEKTHKGLTERGLGYLLKKYAQKAVRDLVLMIFGTALAYRWLLVPLHRLAQLWGMLFRYDHPLHARHKKDLNKSGRSCLGLT